MSPEFFAAMGLFYFALEVFKDSVESEDSNLFFDRLSTLLQSYWAPFLLGLLVSLLTKSPLPVLLVCLGFVQQQFLHFDQAYQTMLGACLGSSLSLWLPDYSVISLYPLVVCMCIFYYHISKDPVSKSVSKSLAVVVFLFFAMVLVGKEFSQLDWYQELLPVIQGQTGEGLLTQTKAVVLGIAFGFFEFSSRPHELFDSAISNVASPVFYGKVCLLLGAQIGETLLLLAACFPFRRESRRVAYTFLATRLLGVLITLFFFPIFLAISDKLVPGSMLNSVHSHLNGVHFLYNLMFVITWGASGLMIIRFMQVMLPSKTDVIRISLSPNVWKMLVNSPGKSFREASIQLNRTRLLVKQVFDDCCELFSNPKFARKAKPLTKDFLLEFRARRDCIHHLVLQNRQADPVVTNDAKLSLLRQLAHYEHLYYNLRHLYSSIQRGVVMQNYSIPKELHDYFTRLESLSDEIWLNALDQRPMSLELKAKLEQKFQLLEKATLQWIRDQPKDQHKQALWLMDNIHRFREIYQILLRLIPQDLIEVNLQNPRNNISKRGLSIKSATKSTELTSAE